MKKILLFSAVALTCTMAHAAVFSAKGHATGYVCDGDATADCYNAEQAAQNKAMSDCYAAGLRSCVVESCSDLDWGGACGGYEQDDYCDAEATIRGS